jgi:hypothetical protein
VKAAVATSLVLLGLIGCARSASVSPSPSVTAESSSPSSEATETQSPRTLTFAINPMGVGEMPHGTVVIDVQGGGYTMTLTVEGLTPGGHYPVNMHKGRCPSPDVTSATSVDADVVADDSGTLTFEKTYAKPWLIPETGQVLTVHGRVPGEERTHIACGDLTN